MKDVPRVQMPGKANSRAYVEATHYDWLVHEMEGLRRKLDGALQERDAMGAERVRLAAECKALSDQCQDVRAQRDKAQAELSAARADAERYRWLREKSAGQFHLPIVVSQRRGERGMEYTGPLCWDKLDAAIDAARAAPSAGAEHGV